jgi:hypothetical protein
MHVCYVLGVFNVYTGMYVCMCTYTYMYAYIYTYIHMQVHVYTHNANAKNIEEISRMNT